MDLSILIPVFNEEENILPMYRRVVDAVHRIRATWSDVQLVEIVYINDGSTDTSMDIIRKLAGEEDQVGYINFSRNFGHQIAVSAGLDHVGGKAVVIIDGDLQDPPELIPELYARYREGYEVVYARRTVRKGESWFKTWSARTFYKIISRITHIEIPIDTGDFRIIDRKIVQVLRRMPEKNKFIRGQIAWAGFRQTGIEYERSARHKGETGYPFRVMFRLAMDGITAFSNLPLKIATMVGFVSFMFSLAMIGYALYARFGGVTVQGWTSTMIVVSLIGGLQLFCLGIIGEYIIRLITNIRNRPLYIIESSTLPPDGEVVLKDDGRKSMVDAN